MKNEKTLASIVLAGALTLFGNGCESDSNKEFVQVFAQAGVKEFNMIGNVHFIYQNKYYYDEGYDGTLDRVVYLENGERIDIRKDNPDFSKYVSIYEMARNLAKNQ